METRCRRCRRFRPKIFDRSHYSVLEDAVDRGADGLVCGTCGRCVAVRRTKTSRCWRRVDAVLRCKRDPDKSGWHKVGRGL